ncbi:MAG: STAS/SEC14 domain-containing protein [Polyangiaceae bacterium]|nr:STAS/SEC14 domain-containing protein [Myxococcales bacterium]MCB9588096.1 STAS/SEC14 domain-containing protein [Polyangiaceae bacterium]
MERGVVLLEHPVARVTMTTVRGVEVLRLEGKMFPTAQQVGDFMLQYTLLIREHAPARVVTDLRQFSGAPLSVHLEYAKFLGRVRHHVSRAAVFGLRPSTGALVRMVLRLAGRHDMLIADSEAQALDWVIQSPVEETG